jgi:hypothetical protein
LATVVQPAVPLWKVIVGHADKTRAGPQVARLFLCRSPHGAQHDAGMMSRMQTARTARDDGCCPALLRGKRAT